MVEKSYWQIEIWWSRIQVFLTQCFSSKFSAYHVNLKLFFCFLCHILFGFSFLSAHRLAGDWCLLPRASGGD